MWKRATAALAGTAATAGGVAAGWALMRAQGRATTRQVEGAAIAAAVEAGLIQPDSVKAANEIPPPFGDGTYAPTGEFIRPGPRGAARPGAKAPARFAVLGDSTAVGYGTSTPDELPAVLLARAIAKDLDRPVEVRTFGKVGADSTHLDEQVQAALAHRPQVALIVIGGNDITVQIPPWRSAARLGVAVRELRNHGVEVVVATCPDFGVIAPIPNPLRAVVTAWSRRLSAAQAKATVAADGIAVPIAREVSPAFKDRPEMFFADGFHPSAEGYARAVERLRPDIIDAARRSPAGADRSNRNPRQ